MQALVAAGVGLAIVPELSAPVDDAWIAVIDLAHTLPLPPRVLALAWHGERVHLLPLRSLVSLAQRVSTECLSTPAGPGG